MISRSLSNLIQILDEHDNLLFNNEETRRLVLVLFVDGFLVDEIHQKYIKNDP